MIWADLKKVGSPTTWYGNTHQIWAWLDCFSVSLDPPLTHKEVEQSSTGSKNEEICAEVICYLHCYNNCAKLMVPSLFSSRLALGFFRGSFSTTVPETFSWTHIQMRKKHWLTGRWDLKRYSSKNSQKSTPSSANLISEINYPDRVFFSFQHSSLQCLLC